jgi:hypothetical protein
LAAPHRLAVLDHVGQAAGHLVGEVGIGVGEGDRDPGRAALVVGPGVLKVVAPHPDRELIAKLGDRDRIAVQRSLALEQAALVAERQQALARQEHAVDVVGQLAERRRVEAGVEIALGDREDHAGPVQARLLGDLAHDRAGQDHGQDRDQPPALRGAPTQAIDDVEQMAPERRFGFEPVDHA